MGKREYIDIIGIHLLKSEVCYAGDTYAKVLASFNEEKGIEYLEKYLQYYLKETHLHFDQRAVISALKYLDKINNTDKTSNHIEVWKDYGVDKYNWDREIFTEEISEEVETIERIRNSNK